MKFVDTDMCLVELANDDVYVRAFSGGVVAGYLKIEPMTGTLVAGYIDNQQRDWIDANAQAIWNILRDPSFPPIWTPAQTALMWCFPDESITDRGRDGISRHLAVYMGNKLNRVLLDKIKANPQTSELIQKSLHIMTDVLGLDLDIRKESNKNKEADIDTAYKSANGLQYSLSDDAAVMRCFYEGRTSTHYFTRWPDGETRCDCSWKKFHWGISCKHELVRAKELKDRETAAREKDAENYYRGNK